LDVVLPSLPRTTRALLSPRPLLRSLAVTALSAILLLPLAGSALAAPVSRIAGAERIDTSVRVAQHGWSSAPHVLLATAVDYPDAIASSSLAASIDAPLLLTAPTDLPDQVAQALRSLGTERVTILGGDRAVAPSVERELLAMGVLTDRIAGESRYDTAAEIANRAVDDTIPVVALALGARSNGREAWPDALSAASLAGLDVPVPTLLTEGHRLTTEAREAIAELEVERVIILGGDTGVTNRVADELRAMGVSPRRAHGTSRYATAVQVAATAMDSPNPAVGDLDARQAVIVSGRDFPDALGAGALAARRSAPLLLTPPERLDDHVDRFVRSGETSLSSAIIVGGERAVSGFVAQEVEAAITGSPRPQPAPACDTRYASPDCTYRYRHAVATWERLAQCESGGNWAINTGNGYYGGIQFSLSSWRAVNGAGYPHQNTKWEQIHRGELLQQRQGWGAWPACSRKLGLR
jgi:putative cell wall-binding protein